MESDNSKKLSDFFGEEYQSLKGYVNAKISDTIDSSAEDIVQDVALKLFSGADRYAPIHNVAGFVYRSLKNRIIDLMRTKPRTDSIDLDHPMLEFTEMVNASTNKYTSDEMVEVLQRCIERLKPAYRSIIVAVDFEGYTYREISEETGIPEGTLMSRRHRAVGILYNEIEQELKKHKIDRL